MKSTLASFREPFPRSALHPCPLPRPCSLTPHPSLHPSPRTPLLLNVEIREKHDHMSDRRNLFNKVWNAHAVRSWRAGRRSCSSAAPDPRGDEPAGLRHDARPGLKVMYPERTFATVDHIVPTDQVSEPFADPLADAMIKAICATAASSGSPSRPLDGGQGIVHIVGPEQGITQPGTTIACGDSHTSTHGAFGAIRFGIGTTQIRDVLATQTLALGRLKVRRIEVNGRLRPGVYAKDVILHIIRRLGVNGGIGFAYEYAGDVFDRFSMEERMTVCNMSIEGGARAATSTPTRRPSSTSRAGPCAEGPAEKAAGGGWPRLAPDAEYDDRVTIDGANIEPTVTWGINPGQGRRERADSRPRLIPGRGAERHRGGARVHGAQGGPPIRGLKIDVAFLGSCTNGRISRFPGGGALRQGQTISPHVRSLVVPGSQQVPQAGRGRRPRQDLPRRRLRMARRRLLDVPGHEPRQAGRPPICASSSNRNFKGRQGSPTGRTLLMSPAMVAAAALKGSVADVRELLA